MFLISLIRSLLSLYALLLLIHFALPYLTSSQQPWMTVLAKICEPGIRIGNQVASRVMPDRQMKIEVGPLAGAVLCYLARMILGWFF